MNDDESLLDRDLINQVFHRLGERLASRGVVADLYVFGGAAMAVAYDARRATRDIDALFVPHGVVLAEARAVAEEFGLPAWWLNDQASSYVARDRDTEARTIFDHPGLRVQAASPKHLLAMKLLAARRRDAETSRSSLTSSAWPVTIKFSPSARRSSLRSRCLAGPGCYSKTSSEKGEYPLFDPGAGPQ